VTLKPFFLFSTVNRRQSVDKTEHHPARKPPVKQQNKAQKIVQSNYNTLDLGEDSQDLEVQTITQGASSHNHNIAETS